MGCVSEEYSLSGPRNTILLVVTSCAGESTRQLVSVTCPGGGSRNEVRVERRNTGGLKGFSKKFNLVNWPF
jgi:hypothetical protein